MTLREHEAPELQALSSDYDLVVCADGAGSRADDAGFHTTLQEVGPLYAWLGLDDAVDGLTFLAEPADDGLYVAHAYPFTDAASTFLVEGPQALDAAEVGRLFGVRARTSPSQGADVWGRFRERTVRPWSRENVVLVGDAAHTVHYSIGHGTCLALEDAAALVDRLADGDGATRCPPCARTRTRGAPSWSTPRSKDGSARSGSLARADEIDLPLGRFAANLLTRGGRLTRDREPVAS